MDSNYWSNLLSGRTSRRRALAASGALTAATALLAACGGADSGGGEQASSKVAPIEDTTKQAKRGGVFKTSRTADALTWDPHVTSSQWTAPLAAVYSRLMLVKPGHLKDSDGDLEGLIAESWEFSPDRLTLTMKLRPNMTWHQHAPVNGRAVDMDDVLFSAKRIFAQATQRAVFSNSVNPTAPITSVTASDTRTLVFKLAFPMVSLPALLAHQFGGYFHIIPREAESAYDVRYQAIGSGPWQVDRHEASVRIVLKRHPGYFDKERPIADGLENNIVPEYASGLAQFKSGALHTFGVRADDVLVTKQDAPELALYQSPVGSNLNAIYFGWRPTDKNPFRDVRLRQALSMTIDRNLFIDVGYNVEKLQAEGFPVERRWNAALPCNYFEGWWLDPQSKDFGPNAQYYQHNVAEAKKLMAAAGFPNGFEVTATSAPDQYGAAYAKDIEVLHGMAGEAGFRFATNIVGYNTGYQPQYRDSRGDFEGTTYRNIIGGDTDAVEALVAIYSPAAGATFVGLDAAGKGDYSGDPYVESQLLKGRAEPDIAKRREIVRDLQRHLGKQQYVVRYPGGASGLSLAWPAVKNHLAFRGPTASYYGSEYYAWLDTELAPFKRS
jgi:peptide/nickel transport system substrate-binding protein